MSPKTKKSIYLSIGIIVSGFLIWKVFGNIDFEKLIETLQNANYFWLIPNIILIAFAMYQRAYRWKFMLAPICIRVLSRT